MKYSHRSNYRKTCPHDPETRAQLGSRLQYARKRLGWSIEDAGKYFQVTDRTWHNWESGAHRIPFAVYKLLRVLARLELPGKAWAGWRLEGDVLITPEGRQITPKDGSWWSLLVRQAAGFRAVYDEATRLRISLAALAAAHGEAGPTEGTRLRGGSAGCPAAFGGSLNAAEQAPRRVTRGETAENDVNIISNNSRNDVILSSWPIHSDSQTPLMPPHAPRPITSASASTPLSALPWMPTCEFRVKLLRPEQSPRLPYVSRLPGQFGKRQLTTQPPTPSRSQLPHQTELCAGNNSAVPESSSAGGAL